MKPKTTWLLLLAAVAVFTFIFVFERHLLQPGEATAPRILPQLDLNAVSSVQVRSAGAPEIRADRTNRAWRLVKPVSYPAEGAAIEGLLKALAQLSGHTRLTAQDLKSHPQAEKEFGFDPPQFSIVLQQLGNYLQVYVGNLTVVKDQVFLQVVGTDGIFVVDSALLRLLPRAADDWRSRAFLEARDLVFDHIAVTNAGKSLELQREAPNRPWRMTWPVPARADNPKIDDLLRKLLDLHATRFVSDEPKADFDVFGLQTPELELALAQGTNVLARLQFGKCPTNDAAQVYARIGGASSVVLVPAEVIAPWRGTYTDFRDRRLISPALSLVDEIEVRGSENFLLRRQTNELWEVAGTNGFPADPALVYNLLASLSTLEIAQFVSDAVTTLDPPTYGLDKPTLQYWLRTSATNAPEIGTNRTVAELQFGTNLASLVYARRADEKSIYGLRLSDVERLPAAAWPLRNLKVWKWSENDVARLTLSQQGQTVQLTRSGTNQWSLPAGAADSINELALDEVLHRLGDFRVLAWAGVGAQLLPRVGITEHSPKLTIELKSGAKWTLAFGRRSPGNLPYAATVIDGRTWIFEFPASLHEYLRTHLGLAASNP